MSIKMKLLVSYIGMIIIPVVLIIITGYLIGTLITFPGSQDIHGEISVGYVFRDKKSEQFQQMISGMFRTHPQHFADPDYLREFESKQNLSSRAMGIVVVRHMQVVYISPGLPRRELLDYFHQKKNDSLGWLVIRNKAFSVRQFNFFSPKGEPCTLYLLTDATSFYRFGKMIVILIPLALILFIIITNGLLTYFMSRKIIRPLKTLQYATEQIKAGNLNFEVSINCQDELGILAEAFEEMRRRLKESLEIQMQYEHNRKELIAGISHDLKTPVTSIKGYVEGILDGVADTPEKLRHYLRTIQAKTNYLVKLIDELFLYSKLDLGRQPFRFEIVRLQELVRDFYEELWFELNEKGIELRFKDDSLKPIWIKADREKLARVIRNLVDNSLKHLSRQTKRRIELGVKDSPGEATVWVGDNGPGISVTDLPFVFDAFFRADRARNTDTDGSGLGLAIAQRIIKEHGGQIRAESNLNEGTVIRFSLPKL